MKLNKSAVLLCMSAYFAFLNVEAQSIESSQLQNYAYDDALRGRNAITMALGSISYEWRF